jgi:hypothetical protein
MFDGKELSKLIRMRKKGSLRPDMDSAGQEAVDPQTAYLAEKEDEMDSALGEKPQTSASDSEMGEGDSSQTEASLKKIMARISSYLDKMKI